MSAWERAFEDELMRLKARRIAANAERRLRELERRPAVTQSPEFVRMANRMTELRPVRIGLTVALKARQERVRHSPQRRSDCVHGEGLVHAGDGRREARRATGQPVKHHEIAEEHPDVSCCVGMFPALSDASATTASRPRCSTELRKRRRAKAKSESRESAVFAPTRVVRRPSPARLTIVADSPQYANSPAPPPFRSRPVGHIQNGRRDGDSRKPPPVPSAPTVLVARCPLAGRTKLNDGLETRLQADRSGAEDCRRPAAGTAVRDGPLAPNQNLQGVAGRQGRDWPRLLQVGGAPCGWRDDPRAEDETRRRGLLAEDEDSAGARPRYPS